MDRDMAKTMLETNDKFRATVFKIIKYSLNNKNLLLLVILDSWQELKQKTCMGNLTKISANKYYKKSKDEYYIPILYNSF